MRLDRSGIGRALLEKAIDHARERRLAALTLTTFRDLERSVLPEAGFLMLDDAQAGGRLRQVLRRGVEHGMPASRRCAMRLLLNEVSA